MIRILHGDCAELLQTLPDNSVESVVTDPPYGLSFMGKRWDYDVPSEAIWAECLRVLKPGGYLLAFAGTRTQHRMAVRIEDAGFEIRDLIAWVYGSGFPKSHNGEWGGTALKPSLEPITVARKPLAGTVEANWREYSTGALNIDGCRIETGDSLNGGAYSAERKPSESEWVKHGGTIHSSTGREYEQPPGRWPANLIHDGSEEVLAAFPDAPGQIATTSTSTSTRRNQNVFGAMVRGCGGSPARGDAGSAARFFYCAKASKEDRNAGLEGTDARNDTAHRKTNLENADRPHLRGLTKRQNHHPTVKPTDLMRYLCRLVTPQGGTVLDPFMGSGSTLKAAELEGFSAIGIELDAEYVAIARRRIAADAPLFAEVS